MSSSQRPIQTCASGITLMALGAIGLAGGLFHGSAGAIAIGSLLLVVPSSVFLLLRYTVRKTRFRRHLPESAFEADEVEVRLEINNRSRLPLFQPILTDCFSPELHTTKNVLFADRVRANEGAEQTYTGNCILPRGIYQIGPLTLTASDPFGWFQIQRKQTEKPRFKVYPAVQIVDRADDLGRTLARIVSELTHGGPGDSDEFFTVRDYRHGDPPRKIHWGLTARRGAPVVREFTRTSAGDLTIFVDRNREALLGIGRGSSMEHAVKLAAALSSRSLQRGHRVQVLSGLSHEYCTAAGSGRDHLQPILELLVRLRPNDDTVLAELIRTHRTRILPGSTVIVMLSPYVGRDRELLDLLVSLRRRGVRVLAVLFDSGSFRQLWNEVDEFETSNDFADRLRKKGISSTILPCSADLRAIFAQKGAE